MLRFLIESEKKNVDTNAKLVITPTGYLVLTLDGDGVIAISPSGRLHKLRHVTRPKIDKVSPVDVIVEDNDLNYSSLLNSCI